MLELLWFEISLPFDWMLIIGVWFVFANGYHLITVCWFLDFSFAYSRLTGHIVELVVMPQSIEIVPLLIHVLSLAMELAMLILALVVTSILENVSTVPIWFVIAAHTFVYPSTLVRHPHNAIGLVCVLFKLTSERAYVLNDLFHF